MKSGLIFTCMAACAMFYNKINVIFLKQYGGDADVGGYGVAWETVEGLSVLVSSALLGKVIFPLLAKSWQQDREAFRRLAGQTARTLWAASLPVIFLICVESDRFLPLIYGPNYASAVTAQRLLTPCLATAFLHNLAAYAMIGMRRHKLLLGFYLSGLVLNIVCCFTMIPAMPSGGRRPFPDHYQGLGGYPDRQFLPVGGQAHDSGPVGPDAGCRCRQRCAVVGRGAGFAARAGRTGRSCAAAGPVLVLAAAAAL